MKHNVYLHWLIKLFWTVPNKDLFIKKKNEVSNTFPGFPALGEENCLL